MMGNTTLRSWALLSGALLLTACGPSADEFREADPTGYDACATFGEASQSGGDVADDLYGEAARTALQAETSEIREASDDRDGGADGLPVIRDFVAFRNACEDAGFSFG